MEIRHRCAAHDTEDTPTEWGPGQTQPRRDSWSAMTSLVGGARDSQTFPDEGLADSVIASHWRCSLCSARLELELELEARAL